MRILMIVQLVDEGDWLRGFIVPWIRALAARVEHLDVLALEQREADLPQNVAVYSMGKEHRHSRLQELFAFHRTLSQLAPKVDVIFSHMTPRYTWLAAPYARLYGKPQVLWFVHRQVTWELRLAHWAATRITTASPESFSIPSPKVHVLGHGIDLTHFNPADNPAQDNLILSVGRLSPIKNHDVLIRAAAHLRDQGCDFQMVIAGGATEENPEYPLYLTSLIKELDLDSQVRLLGAVPYREVASLYHQAALTVNLCPTGGMDKAVLESMASGIPTLVHNRTFLPLLEDDTAALWCESLNPESVAAQLVHLLSQPPGSRAALGKRLSERVRAEYSLGSLADRLVSVFEEVVRK